MINLAGRVDCDQYIKKELERSRIEIVTVDRLRGEVPSSLTGKLGELSFKRAWRYWVVNGPVPIDVAYVLYEDPVGRTDIRAGGDCTCRHPDTCAEWYDTEGKLIYHDPEGKLRAQVENHVASDQGFIREAAEKILSEGRFSRDAKSEAARGVVKWYHIDSEVGLRLFADAMKNYYANVNNK
jgi:hypothetical protein